MAETHITDYSCDIFICYRRISDWHQWIEQIFVPLLNKRVDTVPPHRVFLDVTSTDQPGSPWPPLLANGLGTSKILLVFWTSNFDASDWCRTELEEFLLREKETKQTLIVPLVLNNFESISNHPLGVRNPIDISLLSGTWTKTSVNYEKLDEVINITLAPQLRALLKQAPPYNLSWGRRAKKATSLALSQSMQKRSSDSLPRNLRVQRLPEYFKRSL